MKGAWSSMGRAWNEAEDLYTFSVVCYTYVVRSCKWIGKKVSLSFPLSEKNGLLGRMRVMAAARSPVAGGDLKRQINGLV